MIGTVAQVEGDKQDDIFDGLALKPGSSSELRYVPGEQVGTIVPGEVTLKIDAAAGAELGPFEPAPPETKWEPGKNSLRIRLSRWLGR